MEEEFESLGAEALLPSLRFPLMGVLEGGDGGKEEQMQEEEGGCGAMPTPTPLTVPARGKENHSSRRKSWDVCVGIDTTTCSPSLVWWGTPYFKSWSSLTFFCLVF